MHACAWETTAIYGPEYKNPNTETPKALLVSKENLNAEISS